MTDILQQDIQYLPGVGPNRKKMLNDELGIQTLVTCCSIIPISMWTAAVSITSGNSQATCLSYR